MATFGAILLHLRDPFHALYNALRLTRETAIVTEVHPEQPAGSGLGSVVSAPLPPSRLARGLKPFLPATDRPAPPGALYFLPDSRTTDPWTGTTRWSLPPAVVCRFLDVLGFGETVVTEHEQSVFGKKARLYTVVGRRTRKLET